MVRPRLANVQCTRMQFQPGDQVIVKSRHRLSKEDALKLKRTVEKWAGDVVEVLVVDLTLMDVEIEHGEKRGLKIS
ncbi:hypothetical protein LCGC14_0249270 [marine sediment metagenome]|uniref:Uncharacterized protein n=1 Tax=marine sediment metagenome TaxID=412755 RepID=A0A0F9U9R4_9ZZZZ